MDKKLFGTRINKARKDRGLTAEKLAEACNINSTYLRQIEGGTAILQIPTHTPTEMKRTRYRRFQAIPDGVLTSQSHFLVV